MNSVLVVPMSGVEKLLNVELTEPETLLNVELTEPDTLLIAFDAVVCIFAN